MLMGHMSHYKKFRDGLQAGLQALWRPQFLSAVRNGGFEQTLRNVCLPYIEEATGRMAFTEADERGDLILRSVRPGQAVSTRCEFKTNFACQFEDIVDRSGQAIRQATPIAHSGQDGIAVYAVAELVFVGDHVFGDAELHNEYVKSPRYKLFRDAKKSEQLMEKVCAAMGLRAIPTQGYEPVFPHGICELWLPDGSGFARLHAWTYYIPATMSR